LSRRKFCLSNGLLITVLSSVSVADADAVTITTKHDDRHHDKDGYDDGGDNDNNKNNGSCFKIASGWLVLAFTWILWNLASYKNLNYQISYNTS
jgi:hypothetical protein